MSERDRNRMENQANQSSENDFARDREARDLGAGGQDDQNIGHQQSQQHDVDRDAALKSRGDSARTDR